MYLTPWDVAGSFNDVIVPANRQAALAALAAADPRLRTLVLHHPDCQSHVTRPGHQEAPERITAILGRVREQFAPYEVALSSDFPRASEEQVMRAHSAAYVNLVRSLAKHVERVGAAVPFTPQIQRGLRRQPEHTIKTPEACDTTFSAGSLAAALRAAGAVLHAVDRVVAGEARNALACVRPPGHHAGVDGLLTDFAYVTVRGWRRGGGGGV